MNLARLFFVVLLVVSLSLVFVFYSYYQIKEDELAEYHKLSQSYSSQCTELSTRLLQSKKELEESLQEIDQLNKAILVLENEKSSFQSELQALKAEREKLLAKITQLIDEKSGLENNLLTLEKKFHSLDELKKAIRVAKQERYQNYKMERVQRYLARVEILKKLDEIALQQGNRGYLVKNGQATFRSTKVRVELEPTSKFYYREKE